MKHLVKKRTVAKKRKAEMSPLNKFKLETGCTDEMFENAKARQNQEIPLSEQGLVGSIQSMIQQARPKPEKLMKVYRKKG